MAKWGIDSRLVLVALLLLPMLFYGGRKEPTFGDRLTVTCKNDIALKLRNPVQTSCPLTTTNNTVVFMNEQRYGTDRELLVILTVTRAHRNRSIYYKEEPRGEGKQEVKVIMEADIIKVDKATDKVVGVESVGFDQATFGAVSLKILRSNSMQVHRASMCADCYFIVKLKEIRVYNVINEQFGQEVFNELQTKAHLASATFFAAPHTEQAQLRQIQTAVFPVTAVAVLGFLAHLFTKQRESLSCFYTWVAIALSVASLLYTFPGDLGILDSYKYCIFLVCLYWSLDCLLIARIFPKSAGAVVAFISLSITVFIIGLFEVGTRETRDLHYERIDVFHGSKYFMSHFQARNFLHSKVALYKYAAAVQFVLGLFRPSAARKLALVVFLASIWATKFWHCPTRTFTHDERNAHDLYYRFAFVPSVLLVVQLAATLPGCYFGLLSPS